ncbi:MAG: AAA family ATPase [Lactobacillaceae bacterium]|jgi:exodeoxyribonuclease V alpha subunit|nr:AAA family ATPase [Lactobacillaceae bacterium]
MSNSQVVQIQGTVKTESKFPNPRKVWFILNNETKNLDTPNSFYKVEGPIQLDFAVLQGRSYIVDGYIDSDNNGDEYIVPVAISEKQVEETEIYMRLLISDIFDGITRARAKKAIDDFGTNVFTVLRNQKFEDTDTTLTKNEFTILKDQILEHYEEVSVRLFLMKVGINAWSINDIVEQNISLQYIQKNPYLLETSVDRFTFEDGQKIAIYIDKNDDSERYQAAIYYSIVDSGGTFQTRDELTQLVKKRIREFKQSALDEAIEYGLTNRFFVEFEDRIYVKSLFDAERNIFERLTKLNQKSEISYTAPEKTILDADQSKALTSVLENNITILTGPPGSGKTTVLKELLNFWQKNNDEKSRFVYLAAPTGRAASRMQEVTEYKATTIHKLIGYQSRSSATYNDKNQIEAGLIVIDEMSMIDTEIFSSFLSAIKEDTHLLFIGDPQQLPSISSGNVFDEMINSNLFETIHLTTNHRQNDGSKIVDLSQEIANGNFSSFNNKDVTAYNADKSSYLRITEGVILDLLQKGINPSSIQVITDKNDYVRDLNKQLHSIFNEKILPDETTIFPGDRVIVNKNIDELGVSNGDIGYVQDVGNVTIVKINDQTVFFDREQKRSLSLAYALTTHKAQGGEFDNLIFVLPDDHQLLNTRKLLYTGVSRAKKQLILLGNLPAFANGAKRLEPNRNTSIFDERLSTYN